MKIHNSVALVTGANRGIGAALVEALLAGGAAKVYAAARDVTAITAVDARVVPLALDVTDTASIRRAAIEAGDVTLVINNAGVLEGGSALEVGLDSLDRQFAVNVSGPLAVTQAFAPALKAARGGVVNILSVVGLAPMPGLAVYSASKAAAASLTAALRGTLAADGVSVHGVFPGPVDTDMAAGITLPKTSPADVAKAILAGVEAGAEDIFPDAMAASVGPAWQANPKAVEHQFAA